MADMHDRPNASDGIEMPRPTAAPLILSAGIVLLALGVALSPAFAAIGAVLLVFGLANWIGQFLPGRGHAFEPRSPHDRQPQPIEPTIGAVETMQAGLPGYRMRLPLEVQPVSAGIKGGIVAGLLMPIPALIWGHLSGHGIWYPINLLAGMIAPGIADMPVAELEEFRPVMFAAGTIIHVIMSLTLGLMYGVLLPALPPIFGGQFFWGGVLMPLLWTGASYGLMGVVNPALQQRVDWPWFIASQFVFGVVAATVVISTEKIAIPPKGTGPDTQSLTR